jgi:hypothetical protein
MLTAIEAAVITTDCIRQAVGWTGVIRGGNLLLEVGVVDTEAREAVNDTIVTSPTKGVLSENHRLGPNDLAFTINSTVADLATEVMLKAVPLTFSPEVLMAAARKGPKKPKKKS